MTAMMNTYMQIGFNGWIGGGRTSDEWADVTLLDEKDVDKALGISRLNLEDDLKIDKQDNEPKDNSKTVRFEDVTTVKYEDLDANVSWILMDGKT